MNRLPKALALEAAREGRLRRLVVRDVHHGEVQVWRVRTTLLDGRSTGFVTVVPGSAGRHLVPGGDPWEAPAEMLEARAPMPAVAPFEEAAARATVRGRDRDVVEVEVTLMAAAHRVVISASTDGVLATPVCDEPRCPCRRSGGYRLKGLRSVSADVVFDAVGREVSRFESRIGRARARFGGLQPVPAVPMSAAVEARRGTPAARGEEACRGCGDAAAVSGGWCECCAERRTDDGPGVEFRLRRLVGAGLDDAEARQLLALLSQADAPGAPAHEARRRALTTLGVREAMLLPRRPVLPDLASALAWADGSLLPSNRPVLRELVTAILGPRSVDGPPVACMLVSDPGRGKTRLIAEVRDMLAAGTALVGGGRGPGFGALELGPTLPALDGADAMWRGAAPGAWAEAVARCSSDHIVVTWDDAPRSQCEGSWLDPFVPVVGALDASAAVFDRHLQLPVPTRNSVWLLTANVHGPGSLESFSRTHPHIVDRLRVIRMTDTLTRDDAAAALRSWDTGGGLSLTEEAHSALLQYADARRGPSLRPLQRAYDASVGVARARGTDEVGVDEVRAAVNGAEPRFVVRPPRTEPGTATVLWPALDGNSIACITADVDRAVHPSAADPVPPRVLHLATLLGLEEIGPVVWTVQVEPGDASAVPDLPVSTALALALVSASTGYTPDRPVAAALDARGRVVPGDFTYDQFLAVLSLGRVVVGHAAEVAAASRWDLLLDASDAIEVTTADELVRAVRIDADGRSQRTGARGVAGYL